MNEYVVLVDDEFGNTSSMAEKIEFEDRKVFSFNNPLEFISFLKVCNKELCKLIVIDFSMPNMNGYELIKHIFDNNINIESKMILYSGNINQLKDSDKEYLISKEVKLLEKPATEQIINYAIEFVKES